MPNQLQFIPINRQENGGIFSKVSRCYILIIYILSILMEQEKYGPKLQIPKFHLKPAYTLNLHAIMIYLENEKWKSLTAYMKENVAISQ